MSRSGPYEQPFAADVRTMVIAAAAMVLLVVAGVVSASVFAGPVCDRLAPAPLDPPPVAGPGPDAVTAGLADGERDRVGRVIERLSSEFGVVSGVAVAEDAERVAVTPRGPALLGRGATVLSGDGAAVEAAVTFPGATVVGDGATLYALALENDVTDQVDALQPLDADLAALTCVETALVGSPLAFHLDAGGGELLLLRSSEDGEDVEVQLRDPTRGEVWSRGLEMPAASAGGQGAATSAVLAEGSVIVGRDVGLDAGVPALRGLARGDGEPVWQLTAAEIARHLGDEAGDDGAREVEVLAVRGGEAVVAFGAPEGAGPVRLVWIDVAGGTIVGHEVADAGGRVGVVRRGPTWAAADEAVGDGGDVVVLDAVEHPTGVTVLVDVAGLRLAVTTAGGAETSASA